MQASPLWFTRQAGLHQSHDLPLGENRDCGPSGARLRMVERGVLMSFRIAWKAAITFQSARQILRAQVSFFGQPRPHSLSACVPLTHHLWRDRRMGRRRRRSGLIPASTRATSRCAGRRRLSAAQAPGSAAVSTEGMSRCCPLGRAASFFGLGGRQVAPLSFSDGRNGRRLLRTFCQRSFHFSAVAQARRPAGAAAAYWRSRAPSSWGSSSRSPRPFLTT